jgi:hypothetical protein
MTNKEDNNNETKQGNKEQNDPIETSKGVEQSNDENIDKDFPGYPHYPAKDDILDPGNHTERVDVDADNISRGKTVNVSQFKKNDVSNTNDDLENEPVEEEELSVGSSDADVTAEDLAMLGPKDGDMDMGEDEELASRGYTPRTGAGLDVPDGDIDTATNQEVGEQDEENSYYSLGGDNNDK